MIPPQSSNSPPARFPFEVKCDCSDPNCTVIQDNAPALSKKLGLSFNAAALMLSALKEASGGSGVPGLRQAAGSALFIVESIQLMGDHKDAFKHLLQDTFNMAFVVTRFITEKEKGRRGISQEALYHIETFGKTLEEIRKFLLKKLHRGWFMRFCESRADQVKVNEYRNRVNQAASLLQLGLTLNIHENVASGRPPVPPEKINDMANDFVKKELEYREHQYLYSTGPITVKSRGQTIKNCNNVKIKNYKSFGTVVQTNQDMNNDYSINYYSAPATEIPHPQVYSPPPPAVVQARAMASRRRSSGPNER